MARDLLRTNLGKTLFWVGGNSLIGGSLFWFMKIVYWLTNAHTAGDTVHKMQNEGIIVFVVTYQMGATLIDMINDRPDLKGISFFAAIIAPIFFGGSLFFVYSMITLGHLEPTFFVTHRRFNTIIIVLGYIYCLYGKYILYKHTDLQNKGGLNVR